MPTDATSSSAAAKYREKNLDMQDSSEESMESGMKNKTEKQDNSRGQPEIPTAP
jgi:hypothetical protein